MADLDDAQPLQGEPDLSDLAMVILNIETRDGQQLSFLLAPDEEVPGRMSMDHSLDGDSFTETHTFTITRRTR